MEPGTRLGPYEVVSLVGAGGMGEVYRARDTRLGRDVAVKVLPPEFAADTVRLRRFEQEARAIAALDHPNILAIHDIGSAVVPLGAAAKNRKRVGAPDPTASSAMETVHYLVTELLEGESLRDHVVAAALPVRKAIEIGVQIAQGLAAAHEKGIVHRDLKPANVFLTRSGHVKILDFGLAKVVPENGAARRERSTTAVQPTDAGTAVGTIGYMSPEQLRGQRVDQRSDIFSFGCVLYEMLSGRPPFGRTTAADTAGAILYEDPPGLESGAQMLPGSLCRIVRRCLEKRPDDRFSSAHDLAFALEAASTDTEWRRTRPRLVLRAPRSMRWLAAAALGLGVLVIGGIWAARIRVADRLPDFRPRRISGQVGNVSDARVSPDGTQVAYAIGDAASSDVWVNDVRGGKPIRLTDGSTRAFGPAWFPDGGEILFSADPGSGASIWKVPRLGGSPMLVLSNGQDAAISPDGRRIAFARPDAAGFLRIWVAVIGEPDSARRLTDDGVGVWDHRHPVWSPDGRKICFQDYRNLWLVGAAGGVPRPLTSGDEANSNPVWAPNGRHIYFSSDRDGVRALWRISPDGGGAEAVTRGAGGEELPSISADGRRLVFVAGPTTDSIALVDMESGALWMLRAGRVSEYPAIAPDRGSIVFKSDLAGASDLWWQRLRDNRPVGEPVRLTDLPGECAVPTFSPDGRWIAYYRVFNGQRDVYVMPAQGGTPVKFSGQGKINMEPAWSPDGRQLAFVSDRGGTEQIWAAPVEDGRRAGAARLVSREDGTASYPTWSPDGRSIAYVLTVGTSSEIHVAPVDASHEARVVTSGAGAVVDQWWWAKNVLLVSGRWGQRLPGLRLVAPATGASEPLAIPAHVALELNFPHFELSMDGRLLALYQHSREAELWALDAEEGTF